MKLEYGKRYVTRDGRVTEPLVPVIEGRWQFSHPFKEPGGDVTWNDGGFWEDGERQQHLDLVSEYTEPAAPKCKRETHGGGGCPSPRTCPVHGDEPCVDWPQYYKSTAKDIPASYVRRDGLDSARLFILGEDRGPYKWSDIDDAAVKNCRLVVSSAAECAYIGAVPQSTTLDDLRAQLDRIEAMLINAKPVEPLVPVECDIPAGWKLKKTGACSVG